MVDNRRAKRRKTNSHGSNSVHSSSVDVATSMSSKRDGAGGKSSSSRRHRKQNPSDSNSSSREDDQWTGDTGQSSDPDHSTNSRQGKRKRDYPTPVNTRALVRTTEPFKFFQRLTADLFDHEDAEEFQMPVLKKYKSNEVPGYRDSVPNPMDLGTIKKNLNSDIYVNKSEDGGFYFEEAKCLSDLRLVFNNCKAYNVEDSLLYRVADDFLKRIDTRVQRRSAAAQRIAKAQRAKKLKARKEAERRKRIAAEAKTSMTSARVNKPSAELETSNQAPADVDRRQNGSAARVQSASNVLSEKEGKDDLQDKELSRDEKEEGAQSESAVHITPPIKSGLGTSANLSQNFSGTIDASATAPLPGSLQPVTPQMHPQVVLPNSLQGMPQGMTPQLIPNAMLPIQPQDRMSSFPHPLPQGPTYFFNQHQLPMIRPNLAPAHASGSLLATQSPGVSATPQRTLGSGTSGVPRMMQQISPSNLTGLVQNVTPQVNVPIAYGAPGMPSMPEIFISSPFGSVVGAAPFTPNMISDGRLIDDAGVNAISVPGFSSADGLHNGSEANGVGVDLNDDGRGDSSVAGSDEDDDDDDLDQQGGDITFTFVSTDGMEKKRGRKSVRVMELETQHDNLMKRRRVMLELALELEKRRQVEMPYLEKRKLCEEAAALDYVRMKGVVDILARGMSRPDYVNEVEIDLDVDTVDNSVLREIQYFLKNPAAMTAKESVRQVESQITDIEQELIELRYQKSSSVHE